MESREGGGTNLVEAKVATFEGCRPRGGFGLGGACRGHFLAGLILVPFFALFLPFDQSVDFVDRNALVNLAHVRRALEQGVHVQLATFGAVAQKFKDTFQPAHELTEEAVVVDMDLVDEFVKVVFVTGAEIDERLDGLVGVGGDVLALGTIDDGEHVISEGGEVRDAAIDICGFVDADERFVEDCEEVAEELKGYGLLGSG